MKISLDKVIFRILALSTFINLGFVLALLVLEEAFNPMNLYFIIYGVPIVLIFILLALVRMYFKEIKDWKAIKHHILWPVYSITSYILLYWFYWNFVDW